MKFLLTLLLLLFATPSAATTWYAGTGGSDINNDCTEAQSPSTPKLTITAGVACMTSAGGTGHTLFIIAGTYNETNSSINIPSGTDFGSGANTIAAFSGPGSVTLSPDNPFNFYDGNFHHVIMDGFTWHIEVAFAGATPAHHIRFTNFEVSSFGVGNGFLLGGTGGNEFIDGTITTNTGTDQHHGIYMATANNLVERVDFSDISGYCIQVYRSPAAALDNNVIRYNTFSNCNTFQAKSELVVYYGNNNQVYGNIFKNGRTGGQGMSVGTASTTNLKVYNNTFYNYSGACFYSDNQSPGNVEFKNNICSSTGGITNAGTGTVTYATNLCSGNGTGCDVNLDNEAAATTFTTPGTDLTLKTGSLAIDGGTTLSVPAGNAFDIIGTARPQSSGYDVGAYERIASLSAPLITITSPTSAATLDTSASTILLAGTSDLSSGSVTWSCDRCTPATGTATGTASWVTTTLTLKAGINIITMTATSGGGGVGTDTLTVTYAPTHPGNSLVLALAMDAGSGTTAADTSGSGNTATFVNTPTWAGASAGRYGDAIVFDGTNDHLTIADSNSLDFTQGFSISMWVKPSVSNVDYRALVFKAATGVNSPYEFYASSTGVCGTGGIAGFSNINGASGPQNNACTASPLQSSVWTHLALTWDGATMKLYRQGAVVATQAQTGYMEPSTGTLYIAHGASTEYFQGVIDEVRMYNYAIPITAGANTVFGANCTRADDVSTPSVVGNANCPITAPTPPIAIKIGTAGISIQGTFKLGATSGAQ